eukprot:jgi/Bigna1/86693/estExt_fgenesh1_pg.C_120273
MTSCWMFREKGPKVEGIHTKKSRAHDAAGKQSQVTHQNVAYMIDRCGATLKRLQGTDGLFEALDTGFIEHDTGSNTGHLNSKDILFFLKACRGQKVVTHNDGGSDEEKDFKKAFDIVSKADMDNDGLLDRKEFTQWILGSKYDDENLLKSLNKTVIELKRREPDESLEKVWLRYKDEEGGDKIEEKLSDLLNAIDLDPEGVQSFAFAWKLRHGTMGPISRSEFIAPLKQQGVETWDGLLSWAKKLRIEIKNNTKYKEMYTWLFDYVKEEGIRTIGKDVAEYVWSLALAPFFKDYDLWLKYLKEKYELSVVKRDLWNCLYDFATTEVHSLEEYDRDTDIGTGNSFSSARCWPSYIDDFIDFIRKSQKNI